MQAVERVRQGKSPYGPFDEGEQRVFEEWRRFVRIFKRKKICYSCQWIMERRREEEEEEREKRRLDGVKERNEWDIYNSCFEPGRMRREDGSGDGSEEVSEEEYEEEYGEGFDEGSEDGLTRYDLQDFTMVDRLG